jgi:hypothetical protein
LLARSDFGGIDSKRKQMKKIPVIVKLNDKTIISNCDDRKSTSGFSFGFEIRDLKYSSRGRLEQWMKLD